MKKSILALVALFGTGAMCWAQDTTMSTNTTSTTLQSTGNYAAFGTAANVPSNLQTSLQTTYPSAFSPTWEQRGDWYRASFNNMNRNMQVYYAPNGDNYTVALPVVQSFVPEEVVTKALSMYGNNVYSINRVRGANGLDNYQVTIIENGMSRTEFIGEDGASVAAVDVFRSDVNDMGNMNSSSSNAANADMNSNTDASGTMNNSSPATSDMNSNMTAPVTDPNAKIKHKVKTEDGKEMKIKTKNGKTKVKGDAIETNATGGGM